MRRSGTHDRRRPRSHALGGGRLAAPDERSGRSLTPVALGVGAGVLYANFLVDVVRRGPESLRHTVSEFAAPGEPQAWLYRAAEVGAAALVVRLLPLVRAALPPGPGRAALTGATAVFAVGAGVAGAVPTPCGPSQARAALDLRPRSTVHDNASILSTAGLYAAMAAGWSSTRRAGPTWFHRATGWLLCVGSAASAAFGLTRSHADRRLMAGVSQRVDILTASAWIGCLGALAAGASGPVAARHRGPR